MKSCRSLLWFLMLVLTPSVLLANVGTASMWAPIIHLLFGNVLLGILEAFLLVKVFKAPKWQSVWVMILANYFSAWIGKEFLIEYFVQEQDITIENVKNWLRVFWWAAFGITLLAEFPFIWFSLRNQKRAFLTALKATGILHCLSYSILFWWYNSASATSLITDLEVVSPSELVTEEKYVLYYISQDGKSVQKMNLNSEMSFAVNSEILAPNDQDRLFVRPFNGEHDLAILLHSGDRVTNEQEILKAFSDNAAIDSRMLRSNHEKVEGTGSNFGTIPSLTKSSDWRYFVGFWPSSGIEGWGEDGDEEFWYALETPIAAWHIRNAVHLEGNYLVFQLGKDQICISHHESKKIALLARGKGPVVATPKN